MNESRAQRNCKSIGLFIAALAFALVALMAMPSSAHAAKVTLDNGKGTHNLIWYSSSSDSSDSEYYIFAGGSEQASMSDIAGLKSSNEKVLHVDYGGWEGGAYIDMVAKKAGKAKVTYKYKGKKHTITYNVRKYANPVKSFKVGSKQYATKFKKRDRTTISLGTLSGNVSITPAKGWKLKKIEKYSEVGLKKAKIKNGSKVKCWILVASFVNKKNGTIEELTLNADYDSD